MVESHEVLSGVQFLLFAEDFHAGDWPAFVQRMKVSFHCIFEIHNNDGFYQLLTIIFGFVSNV
jgi:hypothetical protein